MDVFPGPVPTPSRRPKTTAALPSVSPHGSRYERYNVGGMSGNSSVDSFASLTSASSLAQPGRKRRPGASPSSQYQYAGPLPSQPVPSGIKTVRSIAELNKHIEEVQLKMFQESQKLPTIMRDVQKIYDHAHETIELQLHHRRDIANKLNACNQNYVNVFEQMLEEVMKMQRIKYKSHIALVDELRDELNNLEMFSGQQSEQIDKLHQEKNLVLQDLDDEKQRADKLQDEVMRLNNHIKHLEGEKTLFPMAGRVGANALSELELKSKFTALKREYKQQLEEVERHYQDEIRQLQRTLQQQTVQLQEQTATIEVLRKESSVFAHIDKVQMKRPNKDSSCQTDVSEEDGLWDKQDGWILPISSHVLARKRWRQAINFATCPACRGVGRYIAQVASELKKARIGVVDVPGLDDDGNGNGNGANGGGNNLNLTVSTSVSGVGGGPSQTTPGSSNNVAIRKWVLPDELILFLSNLPRSVQAINPFSLLWTAKRAFLILDGKLRADREDFAMGFRPQSMVDYCIEIFLRNAPSRAKAEINLYVFIKSMKEHYQSCAILKLLARLLGITNGSSASNKDKDKDKDTANGNGRRTITSKSVAATAAASSSTTTASTTATGAATASAANATSNGASAAAGNAANTAAKETKDAATDSTSTGNSNAAAASATNTTATNGSSGAPPKRKTTHHPKATKNHFKDHNFFADETALSKEVLAICLFARDCLLSAPYHGVYHTTLHGIRTKCAHYLQDFETSLEKTAQKIFAHTQQQTPTNASSSAAAPTHSTAGAESGGGASSGSRTSRHSATSPTKKKTTPDYIPRHIYTYYGVQEGCAMYVPLDRAVHVLLPFTQHLSHAEVTSVLHYLEDEAVILQPGDGKIYVPDGQRSFIRHVVRLFAYSENRTGRDIESWQYLCDHYSYTIGEENHNFAALKEDVANAASDSGNGADGLVNGSGGAQHHATTHRGKTAAQHHRPSTTHLSTAKPSTATTNAATNATMAPSVALTPADSFHLPPEALLHCLVVNLDLVLLVVAEICRRKLTKVEQQLKVIFEEGDVNHDNVLSFDEFREIVLRVDADCPDRKILRMFREALIQGGDKDVIGPLQYLNVCKDFNLIHLVDVDELARGPLSALCRHPTVGGSGSETLTSRRGSGYALDGRAESFHHRTPHGSFNHHVLSHLLKHNASGIEQALIGNGGGATGAASAGSPTRRSNIDISSLMALDFSNPFVLHELAQFSLQLQQKQASSGHLTGGSPLKPALAQGLRLVIDGGASATIDGDHAAGSGSLPPIDGANRTARDALSTAKDARKKLKQLPVNESLSREMAQVMRQDLHQRKLHRLDPLHHPSTTSPDDGPSPSHPAFVSDAADSVASIGGDSDADNVELHRHLGAQLLRHISAHLQLDSDVGDNVEHPLAVAPAADGGIGAGAGTGVVGQSDDERSDHVSSANSSAKVTPTAHDDESLALSLASMRSDDAGEAIAFLTPRGDLAAGHQSSQTPDKPSDAGVALVAGI